MKLKKLVLAVSLVAAMFGFIGCGELSPDPEVVEIQFRNSAGELMEQFDDCSVDVDPKLVSYIDFKFNVEMDTTHGGFLYWNDFIGEENDVYSNYWLNSKTYRLYVVLRYNAQYRFGISTDNPDADDFYRFYSKNGKKLPVADVEFSTIAYKRTTPMTFELNKYPNMTVDLVDNNEYNPKTQQSVIRLDGLLDGEKFIKGDTVKFSYKIKSPVKIKNLRANLVDNSYYANYWLQLTNTATKDVVVAQNLEASTDGNDNWYENTIIFTIEEDSIAYNSIQLWDSYDSEDPNDKIYTLEFAEMK